MPAISYLQRNFSNQSYISAILFGCAFGAYATISVLSPLFVPFLGVAAVGVYRIKSRSLLIGVLIGALFFENTHSLYLFSTWIFLFIFTQYVMPLLEAFIDCKKCLNSIGAGLVYILFFGGAYLSSIFFAEQAIFYSYLVLAYWILIEMSLSAFMYYEN